MIRCISDHCVTVFVTEFRIAVEFTSRIISVQIIVFHYGNIVGMDLSTSSSFRSIKVAFVTYLNTGSYLPLWSRSPPVDSHWLMRFWLHI